MSIIRLEMSGIKRVLGICIPIIIAQRLIKFTEGYPGAVTFTSPSTVVITVLAVQLVICIIVIQRTGNIFCVCFFRKRNGCNIYYFSLLPRFSLLPLFGITLGTFWSPVAATLAIGIYCIVIRIRIEAIFVICGNRQPRCTYSISFCRIVIANFFTGKDD